MDMGSQTHRYIGFAIREEQAAARAASPESARLHRALAEMYRHEAAKVEAAEPPLRIVRFG